VFKRVLLRERRLTLPTDTFETLNLTTWKHELTMSGGGVSAQASDAYHPSYHTALPPLQNWEFELYTNNRSISRVVNGSLVISPKP
jgi:hypothetical protein